MLIGELLGLVVIAVLAIVWRRGRPALLLLLLAAVLLELRCRCDTPPTQQTPPNLPREPEPVCPHPEIGCTEPGLVPDGGVEQLRKISPRTPDPACPHPETGCTEPGAKPDAATI